MNAGKLNHRITVYECVETRDVASGGLDTTWPEIGTFWGAVEPLRGREATYAGEQLLMEMDTRIRGRYSPLTAIISGKHRLGHQGTLFNVISVAHVRLEQREVEILCKSGVNDG